MAIVRESVSTVAAGNGTLATTNTASGIVAGDVLTLHIQDSPTHNFTAPTGWTVIENRTDGFSAVRHAVYRAVADSSTTVVGGGVVNPNVSLAGTANWQTAVTRYSGVDNTTPLNGTPGQQTSTSGTAPTVPTTTTSVANCRVVTSIATPSANVTGDPSTWGTRFIDGSTNDRLIVYDKAAATATTYGGETYTTAFSGTSVRITFALNPAPVSNDKIDTLVEDFAGSLPATLDDSSSGTGTAVVTGGALVLTPGDTFGEVVSVDAYDLDESSVYFQLEMSDGAGTDVGFLGSLIDPNGNGYAVLVTNGDISVSRYVTNTPTSIFSDTYSPTNHRQLRVSEASGTITFEASPAATSWSTLDSEATNTNALFDHNDVTLALSNVNLGSSTVTATIAGINVALDTGITGSGSLSFGVTAAGVGTLAIAASGTLSFGLSLLGAASLAIVGAGATTFPVTLSGSGTLGLTASGALAFPVTASGTGSLAVQGSGSLSFGVTLAGSGTAPITGSGSLAFPVVVSGAGTLALTGSGALAFPVTLAGQGSSEATGSGTLTFPITLTGVGALGVAGTASLSFPVVMAGVGALPITGSGALSFPITCQGSSSQEATGSGSLSFSVTLSGTGVLAIAGQGSLAFPVTMAGAGSLAVSGTGSLGFPVTLSGAGALGIQASGSLSFPVTMSGSGSLSGATTGDGTLSFPIVLSGSGQLAITGSGTLLFPITIAGSAEPVEPIVKWPLFRTVTIVDQRNTVEIPDPRHSVEIVRPLYTVEIVA